MKYFVISDVHSYYYEMIDALNKAGFDPLNENHTLISLGDITDRGVWPNEVINYLMSLDRKILIRGNHEDLLEELLTIIFPVAYELVTSAVTEPANPPTPIAFVESASIEILE